MFCTASEMLEEINNAFSAAGGLHCPMTQQGGGSSLATMPTRKCRPRAPAETSLLGQRQSISDVSPSCSPVDISIPFVCLKIKLQREVGLSKYSEPA